MSMECLWQAIKSMPLSNKKWLTDRLVENMEESEEYISKEEVLAGIDAGLKDMKAGGGRPAREQSPTWH